MTDLTRDADMAFQCDCGAMAFVLRADGFIECPVCGIANALQWDYYRAEGVEDV